MVTWGLHFMKKFIHSVVLCLVIGSGFMGTVQPAVYDEIISDTGIMAEEVHLNFIVDGILFTSCLVFAQQNKDDSVVTINLNRMAERMMQKDILNSLEEAASSLIASTADDISVLTLQTGLSRATRFLKGSFNDNPLKGGRLKQSLFQKMKLQHF